MFDVPMRFVEISLGPVPVAEKIEPQVSNANFGPDSLQVPAGEAEPRSPRAGR